MKTLFGREPAMWINVVQVGLVMLVTFGIDVNKDQQTWIIAAVVAGFGLLQALATRPIAPSAVTGFLHAIGVLAIGFGLHMTQDQLAAIITFTTAALALLQRAQISPTVTAGA